jgi:predicted RNA-binding protein YlxR (DUF448 family)
MNKVKYISLEKFLKRVKSILKDVYQNKNEYIIFIDKEEKVKISPIEKSNGKSVYVSKEVEELEKKRIDKFLE